MHFYGLNAHHLGAIYRKCKQGWIKKLIQAEMASRCLKSFFLYDLQSFWLGNFSKEESTEEDRVISFLNIILGNTESTQKMWKNINICGKKYFKTPIW